MNLEHGLSTIPMSAKPNIQRSQPTFVRHGEIAIRLHPLTLLFLCWSAAGQVDLGGLVLKIWRGEVRELDSPLSKTEWI